MKTYIGTKIVKAEPMTQIQFMNVSKYTWINIGSDVSPEGYMVEYDNGHKFWSPKDVFEKHYVEIESNDFKVLAERILEMSSIKIPSGLVKSAFIAGIKQTLLFLKVIE